MPKLILSGLVVLLPLAVWLVSQNAMVASWMIILVWLAVIWIIICNVFQVRIQVQLINFLLLCLVVVAVTGWFMSPFLFSLYLLAIGIYFVISPLASVGYILSLGIVYFLLVSQIRTVESFLVLVSLITVIPLAFYLRRKYLKFSVLENYHKTGEGIVNNVLSNRITHFSNLIRQPLVNIKNYTHVIGNEQLESQTRWEHLKRIYDSAALALRELNKFEEETTGKKMRPPHEESYK